MDIWTGSPTVNGGQDQINCEDDLTQDSQSRTIVRNPASTYEVDCEFSIPISFEVFADCG